MINTLFWDAVPVEQQDACPPAVRARIDRGAPCYLAPARLWILPPELNTADGKIDAAGGVYDGSLFVVSGIDTRGEAKAAYVAVYRSAHKGEHDQHLSAEPENLVHKSVAIFDVPGVTLSASDALGAIG